ncbi:MAG: hypothetical protein CVV64_00335 [Candidatus Wallbacteria bacterium HGW-Wallbacteria-1]|jgi:anti-anti-sigma factor|uniref:Anti-sigma factor antagonist n=1 Tax=Candidatus Wallbacteria bacterium HGW-Wallbacteria-1 TaxID=2013854 RepID=A0A2N1PUA3_9BACT|nr:MAG: hypothetical protein CVV64_00335 [Candidatus Wallbacteria bacterium HGW-Wallbacteria-1]
MPIHNLKLKCEIIHGSGVVDLIGSVDFSNCHQLRQVLEALLIRKIYVLVLEMEKIHYMDSSGIGLMLEYSKKCHDHGGEFFVLNVNPSLDKVLRLVKADRYLRVRRGKQEVIQEIMQRGALKTPEQENIPLVDPSLQGLIPEKKIFITYNSAAFDKVFESRVITIGNKRFSLYAHPDATPEEGTLAHIMYTDEDVSYQFVTIVEKIDKRFIYMTFPESIVKVEEDQYFRISQDLPVEFCCIESFKPTRVFNGTILSLSAGALVAKVPENSEMIGLLGIKFNVGLTEISTCMGRVIKISKASMGTVSITVSFTMIDEPERDMIIRHIFRESISMRSNRQDKI